MYIKLLTLVVRLVYARLHASIVFLFVFTYFEQLADSKSALRPTTETLSCFIRLKFLQAVNLFKTRMWANAQPDGRPAERSWRPLFNAAKFG